MSKKIINLYQTTTENLFKTVCLLLAKCYEESAKTIAVLPDHQSSLLLDNMLWSFSQKVFIPHAIDSDPLFDEHPIIITYCGVANLNAQNFKTLMLVNTFDLAYDCDKVIICFTEEFQQAALNLRLSTPYDSTNYYRQDAKGSWKKA